MSRVSLAAGFERLIKKSDYQTCHLFLDDIEATVDWKGRTYIYRKAKPGDHADLQTLLTRSTSPLSNSAQEEARKTLRFKLSLLEMKATQNISPLQQVAQAIARSGVFQKMFGCCLKK